MNNVVEELIQESGVSFSFLVEEGAKPDFTKKVGFAKDMSEFSKERTKGLFDNWEGVKKSHISLIKKAKTKEHINMLRKDLTSDLKGLKKLEKNSKDSDVDKYVAWANTGAKNLIDAQAKKVK